MHPFNKTSLLELANDVNLTVLQQEQLSAFIELLEVWNERTNLISRHDVERIVVRHVRESLWFCLAEVLRDAVHVFDLGTGAGFPGLVMKIFRPSLKMTLLDSRRMKTVFLQEAVEKVGLEDVQVVCDRAENLARQAPPPQFDLITCRAVAKLDQLWQWASPLIGKSGRLAALKGGDLDAEVAQLEPRLRSGKIEIVSMPALAYDPTAGRKMVIISKQD